MNFWKDVALAIIGYSSGTVIAGGVFAFISVIGIVPRFAQKTGTIDKIRLYEDFIALGGLFGTLQLYLDFRATFLKVLAPLFALAIGIFFGSLAVSLAEVLNVVPVFMRRAKLTKGLAVFIIALALGKLFGSLIYFIIPSFTN